MPIHCHFVRFVTLVWLMSTGLLFAAQNALIVIGTTGSPTIANDLAGTAKNIQAGLVQRGFSPDAIEILGTSSPDNKVTSDVVLAALKKRQSLTASDEFWLILLGFSGRNAEGVSAYQVSGPRLSAPDLKAALNAISAKQFVLIGTSDGGGFIPVLMQAGRTVLSATKEEGEIDLPRFTESWAEALKENPQADWKAIAARAAELTDKGYIDQSLTVGEHARLGDPDTGKILEAPFGVDMNAKPAAKPGPGGHAAPLTAADIKVPIRKPNAEWEQHEATPETKKLIADAKAVPNPDGFGAIMLEQRLGYQVGEDRTAEEFVMRRIYIEKEDNVEKWANYTFPQNAPAITTKLEAARIIQPDGSSTVFNPAKLPPPSTVSAEAGALTTVFMPNAHAGCLIEIAYRTRCLLDAGLPAFSEELPVQAGVPVVHTELQLQVPANSKFHYKLRNSDQKPTEAEANGVKTLTWTLNNLPAFEELPYDPPARDLMVMLDVSSLDSWNDLAAWYKRLARGADEQDAAVKAKAEELAEGAKDRMGKIRHAFEFVSALRYVAVEFGVNGIRPRTPAVVLANRYGDCKDKANLLIALLADMGIDAKFVVLNRGSSTDVEFPSWQFNHAIAYVPKAPDAGQPEDLWLDTTDSTAPFPTLPPGDIGRSALVFEKDSARFLSITVPGKDRTEISEHWNFATTDSGEFKGTVETTWSGLADYDVRNQMRGLTPRQRDYLLQKWLMKEQPEGDFTGLKITSADDLSVPMKLNAQVACNKGKDGAFPWPRPSFDLEVLFAAPERNRPLLINNGQKLHLIQTVDVSGLPAEKAFSGFDQTVAGVRASITWKLSNGHNLTRVAELTMEQPLVAQADYAAVRRMLLDWENRLSRY